MKSRSVADSTAAVNPNTSLTKCPSASRTSAISSSERDPPLHVIEQGRVDALLQTTTQNRRTVFEEAAGISRFNQRKQDALRKLERVDKTSSGSRTSWTKSNPG